MKYYGSVPTDDWRSPAPYEPDDELQLAILTRALADVVLIDSKLIKPADRDASTRWLQEQRPDVWNRLVRSIDHGTLNLTPLRGAGQRHGT